MNWVGLQWPVDGEGEGGEDNAASQGCAGRSGAVQSSWANGSKQGPEQTGQGTEGGGGDGNGLGWQDQRSETKGGNYTLTALSIRMFVSARLVSVTWGRPSRIQRRKMTTRARDDHIQW